MRRKSKFTNQSSKESDIKRKKLMCDNINDEKKKEHLKREDN